MSAAARLLRRRSSVLLQQRHKIHAFSFSSLVGSIQPRKPLPTAIFVHRKLTATATSKPPQSTNTEPSTSSGSKALRYTTAGAAILLLSSAAWYATREEYAPQVQHIGLPQIGHERIEDEKIDGRPVNYGPSSEVHEGHKEESVRESEEVIPLEQEQPGDEKDVRTLADDFIISKEAAGIGEAPNTSPQPQGNVDQITPVDEHDTESQEEVREASSNASARESPLVSKEIEEDKVPLSEEGQNELGNLADAVKEKVSHVKDILFSDGSDERDDGTHRGDDSEGESYKIREKLREEFPEMFFSGSADDDEDGRRQDGSENLPEVPRLVEEHLEREPSEETKMGQEKPKIVGVDVLVGAIDTAKQLQAEVDGRTFQDQLYKIQEAHGRELKDFQARISSYAEGTDQLEKELRKEREEAAAALKRHEEHAENRLQSELKRKEREAIEEKEKVQMLEKAQAAASLTREKAEHLEEMHSVHLQVDALRTAFYTRSEEARISHTAHKLAMGAFALEDAVKKGTPFEREADLLIASAGGPGVDPLVDAVVSSLPREGVVLGSGTRAHLHQKFTSLKGALRELALMPSGGGGVFAHLLARLTANLKIREQGSEAVGSEGIEVVIGKVERLLASEDLVEAATVLETGARGTAAEDLAVEWAKQARNQAIIEQGLQALRAHVIAVASGLS